MQDRSVNCLNLVLAATACFLRRSLKAAAVDHRFQNRQGRSCLAQDCWVSPGSGGVGAGIRRQALSEIIRDHIGEHLGRVSRAVN